MGFWAVPLLLAIILGLFSRGLQARLRAWLYRRPAGLFLAPGILTLLFCASAWGVGALSPGLALLIAAYTFIPTVLMYMQGPPPAPVEHAKRPGWADFAVILLLWLPLEFAAGQALVPRPVQGLLHAVAYGVAIVLALFLFLIYRGLAGMKYQVPRSWADFGYPLLGFAVSAAILIPLGLALGFLAPFHAPVWSPPQLAGRFLFILLATALPEEILFRGLIQNSLMLRLGEGLRSLLLSGVIFGCAHLNNGPGPLPNWRYAVLATIAGVVYGRVFQKSGSVASSAMLHAAVNTVKYAVL